MNDNQAKIDKYVFEKVNNYVDVLARLCAQPSVSADRSSIHDCAQLVGEMLTERSSEVEILPTEGNPVVLANCEGSGDKTLLFYLHYDVQPPDPLDQWESPPFELSRRNGKLFARGAADDKGHIVSRLAALDAVRKAMGELPCNIKFVIEGEEEMGSPSLPAFMEQNRAKLSADACVWEFGGVDHRGAPAQSLGMRGILYLDLFVRSAEQDAHSGLGGSILPNSAWRLVWALNTLKDADERILIPGFYDNVKPPSERDLTLLAQLPDDSQEIQQMYGIDGFLAGLTGGLELRRAAVFEPSCTICGLDSGYQGTSTKTVIPSVARAKVDFRLVPDQSPEEIFRLLREHLNNQGFEDVELRYRGGTRPAKTDPDHPFVKLTNRAAKSVYGQDMVTSPMIGGSGPSYLFIDLLNVPIVAAGVGYPGSRAHAPNEHIRLDDFVQGIRHTAYILEAFGRS